MQERSAAHMKALQRMRETAEAAEVACCAAEHMEAPCGPSADATAPSAASVKAFVPKPPATSPALQDSSYLSLQKAGAVMLGILCELHWSDELCVANGDSGQLTSVQHSDEHAGQLHTKHGTVIKGSCLIAGAKEPGERWRPFGQNIIAEQCPVDVMCVQATTLLQHPQFADALTELRHVLTCLRSFCSSVVRPPGPIIMDPFQPCLQAPCPPGPACAPVQCPSTSMPCPAVLAGQQSASLSPHAQNPLPTNSGLPQSTQQALSVLGPLPLAAACWSKTTVTFLGTGSAEPSKYRGPTALLLEVCPLFCCSSLVKLGIWLHLLCVSDMQVLSRVLGRLCTLWFPARRNSTGVKFKLLPHLQCNRAPYYFTLHLAAMSSGLHARRWVACPQVAAVQCCLTVVKAHGKPCAQCWGRTERRRA